ncbi:MAG TPA: hypothetical protein GX696_11755 [Pseudomonadaceae bacterium]|nr:hypothetical protein [Pseudomonadaceae bacterium]
MAPSAREADSSRSALPLAELRPARWIALFEQLQLAGVTRSMAAHSVLADVTGNVLSLVLDENNATLFNDEHRKGIEQALTGYFAVPVELRMSVARVDAETPAAWRRRREQEHREAAHKLFTQDPLVQTLVRDFDARINTGSIASLESLDSQDSNTRRGGSAHG